ncbi:hypothetical protein, partial [Weissella confusa]|uniref:hypothetical protein n=1 Tax=Weissella confusa TaxID=1583 RepID=UPI0018F1CE7A
MSKTYQEFVEARKRNERKMPFAPVVTGPLLFPFFKDVLEPVPEVMINDDGLPVVVTKDDLLYFLKHNISPFVTVGMANKTMWEAMNAIKAASHSDWAKSGPGALMSRLWTGFFGTESCRTPKIFQNPDFTLKRRDFWVFFVGG